MKCLREFQQIGVCLNGFTSSVVIFEDYFLLCTETKPHLTNGQSKYLAKVTYLTNIFIMAFGCHDILLTYRKHT